MPIIQMHLMVGRTPQQKRDVAAAVTEAVSSSLQVPPNKIRILICELGVDDFYVAGQSSRGAVSPEANGGGQDG